MKWSPIKYRWQWHIKCSTTDLWNLVADAKRLKVALGLADLLPQRVGTSAEGGIELKKDSTLRSLVGLVKDVPVNWLKENEFSLELNNEEAPIRTLSMRVRLEADEQGAIVTHLLTVYPGSIMGKFATPWAVGKEVYKNLDKLYQDYQEYILGGADSDFFTDVCNLTPEARNKVSKAAELLMKKGFRESWVRLLCQYLSQESEGTLQEMHPFTIAHQWGVPEINVMELFLTAVSHNLLRLRWQQRCPRCREICYSKLNLSGIRRRGYCSKCASYFPNHLERTIELSFFPHPSIRPLQRSEKLCTGPVAVPHIHIQQVLQPHEVRTFSADFLNGQYRVRTLNTEESQWSTVTLNPNEGHEVSAEVTEKTLKVRCTAEPSGVRVRLCNRTVEPQIFCFEDDSWKTSTLNARIALNNQVFRSLFPGEVLPVNDPQPIGKLTLMVSKITHSTSLFLSQGDLETYFLLREYHTFFQNIIAQYGGAIIKSFGDHITSAFTDPVQATKAALAVQEEFGTFNATLSDSEKLSIQLGVHYGPCYAVNFNNVLDYFGKTVNLAWCIQEASKGNDVVFSRALWKMPKVRELLEFNSTKLESFHYVIPDLDKKVELFRISS